MEEEALLLEACKSATSKELSLVKKALLFGEKAHKGQVRKASGQPYFIHPIGVALRLQEKFSDIPLTIAALLHDTVEDSDDVSMGDIYTQFGQEIGYLVDSVTKNHLNYFNQDKQFTNKDQKLFSGGAKDIRCFLLKIADRENNLLTLSAFKNKKQIRISFETQAIYSPLQKILNYDDPKCTIETARANYETYINKNKSKLGKHIEEYLFHQTFKDFNRDMFDQVYTCSENIVWEVHDLDNYERLCYSKQFDPNVEVISLWATANGDFVARFKFLSAKMLQDEKKGQMKVSSFST